jgi:uncharacterized membrane protein YkgB
MRTPHLQWMATRGRPGGGPYAGTAPLSSTLSAAVTAVLRCGIVLNLFWFGAFKVTPTEAQGIQPLIKDLTFFAAALWTAAEALRHHDAAHGRR